jgi:hypothetical protein
LLLNGARFVVRTETSLGSLASVLGAAHARCAERSLLAPRPRVAENRLSARGAALVAQALAVDGVLDAERDGEGVVACVETNEGKPPFSDPQELGRALAAAAESGDLSVLGSFRYVYARADRDGRTGQLELTSEGSLNVRQMFPKQGDAPGIDDAELPRPAGTRRVLSVVHEVRQGIRAAALTGYESPQPASELRRAYATELRARGFDPRALEGNSRPLQVSGHRAGQNRGAVAGNGAVSDSGAVAQDDVVRPLVVRNAGRTVIVTFSERRTSPGSWVLLLPLP